MFGVKIDFRKLRAHVMTVRSLVRLAPQLYREAYRDESRRLIFLEELGAGYTPSFIFNRTVRAMREAGLWNPADEAATRRLHEGFAREAGVGWDEVLNS